MSMNLKREKMTLHLLISIEPFGCYEGNLFHILTHIPCTHTVDTRAKHDRLIAVAQACNKSELFVKTVLNMSHSA